MWLSDHIIQHSSFGDSSTARSTAFIQHNIRLRVKNIVNTVYKPVSCTGRTLSSVRLVLLSLFLLQLATSRAEALQLLGLNNLATILFEESWEPI